MKITEDKKKIIIAAICRVYTKTKADAVVDFAGIQWPVLKAELNPLTEKDFEWTRNAIKEALFVDIYGGDSVRFGLTNTSVSTMLELFRQSYSLLGAFEQKLKDGLQ